MWTKKPTRSCSGFPRLEQLAMDGRVRRALGIERLLRIKDQLRQGVENPAIDFRVHAVVADEEHVMNQRGQRAAERRAKSEARQQVQKACLPRRATVSAFEPLRRVHPVHHRAIQHRPDQRIASVEVDVDAAVVHLDVHVNDSLAVVVDVPRS